MPEPGLWRNRIVGYGMEAPDQLLASPQNWRIHPVFQQQALTGVLDQVGYVAPILVNKTTGHVVDGHLRVELALRRDQPVPVVYVELTPEEEALILASFDPLGDLAVTDQAQLAGLLASLSTESPALQEMFAGLMTATEQTHPVAFEAATDEAQTCPTCGRRMKPV